MSKRYHEQKKSRKPSAKEVRKLGELRTSGLSIECISKRMLMPAKLISTWLRELGMPVNVTASIWNDANLEVALRKLWKTELSTEDIGKQLSSEFGVNVTKGSVMGKAHRLGLDPKPSWKQKPKVAVTPPINKSPSMIDETDVCDNDSSDENADGILITKLSKNTCRWPIGNGNPWRFCGCQTVADKPYCAEHFEESKHPAYRAMEARRRAAAKVTQAASV
jgi:hypothetical protein